MQLGPSPAQVRSNIGRMKTGSPRAAKRNLNTLSLGRHGKQQRFAASNDLDFEIAYHGCGCKLTEELREVLARAKHRGGMDFTRHARYRKRRKGVAKALAHARITLESEDGDGKELVAFAHTRIACRSDRPCCRCARRNRITLRFRMQRPKRLQQRKSERSDHFERAQARLR